MNKILLYLKAKLGRGLPFKSEGRLSLETYTDVDHARLIVDWRSTSGYYVIGWKFDYMEKQEAQM